MVSGYCKVSVCMLQAAQCSSALTRSSKLTLSPLLPGSGSRVTGTGQRAVRLSCFSKGLAMSPAQVQCDNSSPVPACKRNQGTKDQGNQA